MKETSMKMDSRTGLDYIVDNKDYVGKLGSALDTQNITVKKQVFELLSALCAYSSEGYNRALETLEHYMNLKSERYRFKLVVVELDSTTTVEYQIALLAFINCLIISAPTLEKRIKIRNEFIGLNLLPVINNLRRVAANVSDIKIQLDVFDEQRESDEAQSLQDPDGINLNSHLDVFYAILRQVADTPQGIPFLSILQHLLRIDPKEAISDLIWDTAETLVHRATLLENRDDSVRLLRAPSVQKFTCPHCRGELSNVNRKQSLAPTTPIATISSPPSFVSLAPVPPAPPPPPAPIPPPPIILSTVDGKTQNSSNIGIPPPPPMGPPNAPPAPPNSQTIRPKTPEPTSVEPAELLPQQDIPIPQSKMKTINWNKIPSNKVLGKTNIWSMVATTHKHKPITDLDWAEIEGLFCQQITQNTQGSPKLGRDRNDTLERKKKENSEINLLDGKRSLNVNIFLKQFRSSNEDIIQLIKDGEHDEIGAEKLRGLLKILPEVDEFDMLKSFDGDKSRLGNAEKFLLDLLKLSNYKLRIESMLLKEEFAVNMGYLEPAINAMLYAGEGLMMNKSLQEVLYMVLVTGNFLNFGGYAGNAAGVKLSSLQKLTDIRANKPGMNLIHFVALQAEKVNKDLLKFPDELTALENASKISVEQLNNELTTLDTRIKKIKKHIELPTTDADIKDQMMEFLQMAEREVSLLQRNMKELDLLRNKLAEFFCEDANSFKIEECFKVFQNFREKFRLAVIENERRKVQEEQATLRRKQREDQLALKKRHLNLPLESPGMENNDVLDPFQGGSPALSRRRFGSFHNNGDITPQRDTGPSPEGSLRRRKSRNLNEEDTLMDFLRSSGHDNFSRERKTSYGSLDRSWARRARTDSGSSSRKRPDLFHVDFGANRERAHSPSPLAEVKDLPSDETKPRISKEWHQKIQSWLQHNDHDDRKSGDYKVKSSRLLNRRSYEEESENERNKLDPLPEEKISPPIEPSKRTQSKWKPSNALERTDIVGTIEAIQDAQPNPRESSSWLSSENQRLRRQLSREKSASPQLESILEENKRKLVIKQLGERDASDQIHMYIRRPSDTHTMDTNKSPISIKVPQLPTELSTSRSGHKISVSADNTRNIYVSTNDTVPNHRNSMRRDKIEIDSDNIETPPSPRKTLSGHDSFSRNLQAPRPLHKETIEGESGASFLDKIPLENDAEVLGNGQFDRFSSARKTRRYKRPTNINSGSDEANMSPTEPLIEKDKNSPTNIHVEASVPVYLENKQFGAEDKEARLKRWQERLKSLDRQDDIDSPSDLITSPHATNRKNHSIINPNEVKEAANNLKNVTSTKIINNELNDEGFEESQSLVSDTPSQGKETLSGNENNDTQCDIKKDKPMRMTSTESATTSGSSDTKARADVKVTQSSNVIPKRSLSVRSAISNLTKREVPNRHNSLRKNDSQSSISSQTKRNVERSSSRTSLRSSRSSLNSAVSSSTVKRVPSKPSMYHKSSSFDTKKPPSSTSLQHSALRLSQRIPASRSSSSNSSVGSTTIGRYPPPPSSASSSSAATAAAAAATATTNNNINNNISSNSNKRSLSASHNRENQNAINSGTTAYPLKSSSQHNSSTNSINSYKINNVNLKDNKLPSTASTPPIRQNNFMRPTAASSTKAQTQPQTSVKGRFK